MTTTWQLKCWNLMHTSRSRAKLVALVCSCGGPQGAGNRDYCAVATQGVQAESVLAWLAACLWAWAVCFRLSQGARK